MIVDSVHRVTGVTVAAISLSNAEVWVRVLSAAIPAALASAYTVWSWWQKAKHKPKKPKHLKQPWEY